MYRTKSVYNETTCLLLGTQSLLFRIYNSLF